MVVNVAGKSEPITVEQCAQLMGSTVRRLPSLALCRTVIETAWALGATSIPPDAFPYLMGSYWMDTSKLRTLLGKDYEQVIRYTNEAALADSAIEPSPAVISETIEVTEPTHNRR
jgi:hypothetical protein